MHARALLTYVRVHRYLALVLAANVTLAVTLMTCRIPIPVFTHSLAGAQTQAIAFHLAPFLCLPVASRVLDGAWDSGEQQAHRRLAGLRTMDVIMVTVAPFAAIVPVALALGNGAVQVTLQNVMGLTASLLLIRIWLPSLVAWTPSYALGLLGVMGTGHGTWFGLHLTSRQASAWQLAFVAALLTGSTAVHAVRRPRPALLGHLAE